MRRREKPSEAALAPPPRLQRFDPSDWPDAECHPECAFWEAWERWHEEHPDFDMPLDWIIAGPDTPWHPELI